MLWEPVETSLDIIENGISGLTPESLPLVLKALDRFQQEPLVLIHRNVLTKYISLLTDNFFELSTNAKLLRCQVFYTISKVISWKRSVQYLPTNIYILRRLVPLLEKKEKEGEGEEGRWYIDYFILSWIYVLCLSPFQLQIDEKVYRLVSRYRTPSTVPLVVNIHSQLLCKNKVLFEKYKDELNLATFNGILKIIIHQKDAVMDLGTLDKFRLKCLEEPAKDCAVKYKIFPKLFLIYALEMNTECLQEIITCLMNQFDDDFTDIRFAIAHCYAKIVKIVIDELEEDEMFDLLIENCLAPTIQMLKFEPWDILEQNRLHTYLLVIAELSNTIVTHSPPGVVDKISQDIIPYACIFQQLRGNTIKGSQIRDASNFICWSLSRANMRSRIREINLNCLFLNVLMCSLFDRELLIRKSANAALQEILGRYVTFAGILDNKTILQIIELPINNLPKHFNSNTLTLYRLLNKNNKAFSKFMIKWLFDSCIMQNHDLSIVQWTTWALCQWAVDLPEGLKEGGFINLIEDFVASTPFESFKLLYLLVQMQLHGVPLGEKDMNAIAKEVMVSTRSMKFRKNDYEIFKFLAIFEYIILMLRDDDHYGFRLDMESINLIFRMLKGFSPYIRFHQDVVRLLRVLLSIVSTKSNTKFTSVEVEIQFWDYFENLIRSNNSCCCYSFSAIEPHRCITMFRNNLPRMNCQGKSQVLDSFNTTDSFQTTVQVDKHILMLVAKLLNDYTVTEQGDVGRLVRTSAAHLVLDNRHLFMDAELNSIVVSSLVRLSGEPNEEIRIIAMKFLQKNVKPFIESQMDLLHLIKFQSSQYKIHLKQFWKGFLMSAGAIHSTEMQVRLAIDSFLQYYNDLSNIERLLLCNDLVRIIPSATSITEGKSRRALDAETGIFDQDILKVTISYINFWHRILESGIQIDQNFNFQGFYAKLYNLHLLNGVSLLRSTIVGFLGQLMVSIMHSRESLDKKLINSIIQRLLTILKREVSCRRKSAQTVLEQVCLRSLATIFLELKLFKKLHDLIDYSNSKEGIFELPISMFMV